MTDPLDKLAAGARALITAAVCGSRDYALEQAIEICESIAAGGGSAQDCAVALKKIRAELPQPPSRQN